jgi:hypothetical protein
MVRGVECDGHGDQYTREMDSVPTHQSMIVNSSLFELANLHNFKLTLGLARRSNKALKQESHLVSLCPTHRFISSKMMFHSVYSRHCWISDAMIDNFSSVANDAR